MHGQVKLTLVVDDTPVPCRTVIRMRVHSFIVCLQRAPPSGGVLYWFRRGSVL